MPLDRFLEHRQLDTEDRIGELNDYGLRLNSSSVDVIRSLTVNQIEFRKVSDATNGDSIQLSNLNDASKVRISNIADPKADNDVVTLGYLNTALDTAISSFDAITGIKFTGSWDASTNTPMLVSGTGTAGQYYIISIEGETEIDGITDWKVGDWIIFQNTITPNTWQKIDNSCNVSSINTYTGEVVLTESDIPSIGINYLNKTGGAVGSLTGNTNAILDFPTIKTASFESTATTNTLATELAMSAQKISGLGNGTVESDAVNYGQLTTLGNLKFDKTGGVLNGDLSLGQNPTFFNFKANDIDAVAFSSRSTGNVFSKDLIVNITTDTSNKIRGCPIIQNDTDMNLKATKLIISDNQITPQAIILTGIKNGEMTNDAVNFNQLSTTNTNVDNNTRTIASFIDTLSEYVPKVGATLTGSLTFGNGLSVNDANVKSTLANPLIVSSLGTSGEIDMKYSTSIKAIHSYDNIDTPVFEIRSSLDGGIDVHSTQIRCYKKLILFEDGINDQAVRGSQLTAVNTIATNAQSKANTAIQRDGTVPMTGTLDCGQQNINNVGSITLKSLSTNTDSLNDKITLNDNMSVAIDKYITLTSDGTADSHLVTKKYVDDLSKLPYGSGNIYLNTNYVKGSRTAHTTADELTSKGYVDGIKATLEASIATKLPKAGGNMTGNIDLSGTNSILNANEVKMIDLYTTNVKQTLNMNTNHITGLGTLPITGDTSSYAVSKSYVDDVKTTLDSAKLSLSGGGLTGTLNMNDNQITNTSYLSSSGALVLACGSYYNLNIQQNNDDFGAIQMAQFLGHDKSKITMHIYPQGDSNFRVVNGDTDEDLFKVYYNQIFLNKPVTAWAGLAMNNQSITNCSSLSSSNNYLVLKSATSNYAIKFKTQMTDGEYEHAYFSSGGDVPTNRFFTKVGGYNEFYSSDLAKSLLYISNTGITIGNGLTFTFGTTNTINANSNKITNVSPSTTTGDVVVHQQLSNYLPLTGGSLSGTLNCSRIDNMTRISLSTSGMTFYDGVGMFAQGIFNITSGGISLYNNSPGLNFKNSDSSDTILNLNNTDISLSRTTKTKELLPQVDNTSDLGRSDVKYKDVWCYNLKANFIDTAMIKSYNFDHYYDARPFTGTQITDLQYNVCYTNFTTHKDLTDINLHSSWNGGVKFPGMIIYLVNNSTYSTNINIYATGNIQISPKTAIYLMPGQSVSFAYCNGFSKWSAIGYNNSA